MNQVPGPLGSASHCLSILEGGRSPGFWRQEMSRRVEPLSAMQLNSSWICELADIDLRLCGQPLLGETLAALTGRNTVTNASTVEEAVTRKPFSESTPTRKSELKVPGDLNSHPSSQRLARQHPEAKRNSPAPAMLSTTEQAEAVLQLPPQAGVSLLRRIAGDISELARDRSFFGVDKESVGVKNHSAPPKEVASRTHHQPLTSAEKSRLRSVMDQPPAPVVRAAGEVELARRVQRVARRIEATFQRRSLLTHDFLPAAGSRDKVLPIDLQSLTDHWSIPVDGPAASAETLTRLANFVSSPDRGGRPDVERESAWTKTTGNKPTPVAVEPSPKNHRHTSTPSTVHQSRNSEHAQLVPWDTHVRQPWSNQDHDAAGDIAPGILSESTLPKVSDAEGWSGLVSNSAQPVTLLTSATAPAIAPPSLTSTLPPLHTQKHDDVIMPIAVATAQRQARIEEDIAGGEDLNLLAERIERILKQEARRHGIDV